MKKTVFFFALVFCAASIIGAQQVLSSYHGFWEGSREITVLDLIEFYPNQLPFVRNEIYARYGRPFVNKTYQDYFRAKSWYQEKSNFSESWLTKTDRKNAELILSLEQPEQNAERITASVLRNIEYTDGQAILTFTSRQELVWFDSNVDFGAYGIHGESHSTMDWIAMGDWILLYADSVHIGYYQIVAYKVNHETKRITSSAVTREMGGGEGFNKFLRSLGREPRPTR